MKLVTLVENTTLLPHLTAEHGLSLWVEAAGKRILFDAGQTGAFAANARKLGIDLASADFAVLSHGHYDHGGGMARFREWNPQAPIYVHHEAFGQHYNGTAKYIGLPADFPREGLLYTADHHAIAEGLNLFTCNACNRPYPTNPWGLNVRFQDAFLPEEFRHEQYLLIEEGGRRILLSGCSHKGILNLLHWFRPDVLIGGFHFKKLPPDSPELREAARELQKFHTEFYTGHCTGEAQFAVLKEVLGERLHSLPTGTVLEL